jgi:hypothetical protein
MKVTALALALILTLLIVATAGAQCIAVGKAKVASFQTVPLSAFQRQFNVNLVYAYFQGGAYGTVVLNFTSVSNQTFSPDEGITEVYNVTVFSNGSIIGSSAIGCSVGRGIPWGYAQGLAMSLGHVSFSGRQGLNEWSIIYHPLNPRLVKPISLTVSLMGWIEIDGNSTFSNLNGDEAIQQVTLEKFQNGYLYNTLVPQEQLLQIDLLNPQIPSDFTSASSSPSPSTSPTPSIEPQQLEPFAATSVAAAVVSVVLVGAGLIVYFRKRKG